MTTTPRRYAFASDNTAGLCPQAWAALEAANTGSVASYGDDSYTQRAADGFRTLFETNCDVYFVFSGTAANALALASLCESYHAVVAADVAHIETDECGAPEFFSNGTKLLLAPSIAGRVDPAGVQHLITRRTDVHYPKPRVLSLSQSTELETIYSPEQIGALCELAHRHGLRVHMDGARFANAVAASGKSPAELSWRAGVDVLVFGGTKLGVSMGEAVIFFERGLSEEFAYRCKQAGQLASKMRYLAAGWADALERGYWLGCARHANAMASRLGALLRERGIRIVHPVETNAVYVRFAPEVDRRMRERGWVYYDFIGGDSRLMCSWATTEADLESLVADVRG